MATFLCIGDSLTVGADGLGGYSVDGGYRRTLQMRLSANGFPYTFIGPSTLNSSTLSQPNHAGYSGYKISEVSPIVLAMSATPAPDYILLDIGTNDIQLSYDLPNLNSRLDTFISDLLAKWPAAQIFCANLFPASASYTLAGAQITAFSSYQSHIAALTSATPVTEMNTAINASFQPDGLHPNAAGYQIMGDVWYTALITEGVIAVADTKVSALGSLSAQPASNDLLPIVDVSDTSQAASGTTKKIVSAYFAQTNGSVATITGGGTISLGGYTLTVPATGTAALLATAQSFTATKTFAPSSTSDNAVVVNMPSSTSGLVLSAQYSGTARITASVTSTVTNLIVGGTLDAGSSYGPYVQIDRNANGSTPAAGFINFSNRAATYFSLWFDASGNLRGNTSPPTNANDAAGTVIGTQTSMAAAKNINEALPNVDDALQAIVDAARNGLRSWTYKSGAYNGEVFPNGIVTDLAPRYGMDRDEEHPAGKSLNVPVAIGDLIAVVALLAEKCGLTSGSK